MSPRATVLIVSGQQWSPVSFRRHKILVSRMNVMFVVLSGYLLTIKIGLSTIVVLRI